MKGLIITNIYNYIEFEENIREHIYVLKDDKMMAKFWPLLQARGSRFSTVFSLGFLSLENSNVVLWTADADDVCIIQTKETTSYFSTHMLLSVQKVAMIGSGWLKSSKPIAWLVRIQLLMAMESRLLAITVSWEVSAWRVCLPILPKLITFLIPSDSFIEGGFITQQQQHWSHQANICSEEESFVGSL